MSFWQILVFSNLHLCPRVLSFWMGSDASEVQDTTAHPLPIKVYLSMCTQLLGLVDRISNIFPSIEAARPRCSSGIQTLCQLQAAIERARELDRNCRVSSKLYLAITGETVRSRFEKARNVLDQSLSQLQSMVPVALELEISAILYDLRDTRFFIDSDEELAGKALRGILQKDESPIDSVGNSEIELLLFAASMLHITSHTNLLIEKRCLRRLIGEVKEGNSTKKKTLKYLYYLLKKYDKLIVETQPRNSSVQYDIAHISADLDSKPMTKSSGQDFRRGHFSYFRGRLPPEEFICPLSSRLMVDPVIISSGQTFERSYIEKWFHEGHDRCPRTSEKLSDLSIRPNTSMRNLITKWSLEQGDEMSNRSIGASFYGSLETSNSLHSTASSMKGIDLQIDASNLSLGSLDSSYGNISQVRTEHSFKVIKESSDAEPLRLQFYASIEDIRTKFLSNVRGLPWELQVAAIEDVNTYLIDYNPSCSFVSSGNFLEPLISFLQEALDKDDEKSQKAGSQLFLTFLQASRREPVHIDEHVYTLFASLLLTEAAGETLDILEALSIQVPFSNFKATSTILASILKILDSNKREFQASAFRILQNLSLKLDSSYSDLASEWISVLVPFLEDKSYAGACLSILKNLYRFEEIRLSAKTQDLIAQIIKLLDKFNYEDQENAVDMLLSLCTQHEYFCQLVLHEGGIPPLVLVSNDGSNKGKASASELLRQLRETKPQEDVQESPTTYNETPENCQVVNSGQKSSKGSGFKKWLFRKK